MNKDLTQTNTQVSPKETEVAYRKPYYEVNQAENAYELEVHLPGVAKDAATITLDGSGLTIEAMPVRVAKETWTAFRQEIASGAFKLRLELNVEIDDEAIEAHFESGILRVKLPLAAKAAKRSITIE